MTFASFGARKLRVPLKIRSRSGSRLPPWTVGGREIGWGEKVLAGRARGAGRAQGREKLGPKS